MCHKSLWTNGDEIKIRARLVNIAADCRERNAGGVAVRMALLIGEDGIDAVIIVERMIPADDGLVVIELSLVIGEHQVGGVDVGSQVRHVGRR